MVNNTSNSNVVSNITSGVGDVISTVNFFKNFDPKSLLIKIGISLSLLLLSGGGIYFAYQWEVNRSNHQLAAAIAAAHAQGVAEANSANAIAANQALSDNIKKIQDMQAQTQQQLDDIQSTADASKKKIDSFDVKNVIKDHPAQVEKWANDTNNGLFNDISEETVK